MRVDVGNSVAGVRQCSNSHISANDDFLGTVTHQKERPSLFNLLNYDHISDRLL